MILVDVFLPSDLNFMISQYTVTTWQQCIQWISFIGENLHKCRYLNRFIDKLYGRCNKNCFSSIMHLVIIHVYVCYTGPNNVEVIHEPFSYLPCSILVLLCCCPLFGFVALIYSFQVSEIAWSQMQLWIRIQLCSQPHYGSISQRYNII